MGKRWSAEQIPDLKGVCAVVSGANSGIGLEASRELLRRGAHVILACRNPDKAQAALDGLKQELPGCQAETRELDLSSLASVQRFADGVTCPVDLLLNNAGVMAIPRRTTEDGFEMQLGTNHLGHFALTLRLLPRLVLAGQRGAPARVVTVSSIAHRIGSLRLADINWERSYNKWAAYGQSKLANLLFMHGLADRLEQAGLPVVSVACHPGYSATNLAAAGPQMENARIMGALTDVGGAVLAQSAAQGALPTLFAACAPDIKSRDYIGPGGPFELRGAPKHAKSSRASRDPQSVQALWEISERLTGVEFSA